MFVESFVPVSAHFWQVRCGSGADSASNKKSLEKKSWTKTSIDLNGVCELKCIGRMRNGKIGIENKKNIEKRMLLTLIGLKWFNGNLVYI